MVKILDTIINDNMKTTKKTGILVTIILLISFAIIFALGSMINTESFYKEMYEVNDENDDGRTFTSATGYGNEHDDWALLQLSPSYSFGLKFDNISVPQGARYI